MSPTETASEASKTKPAGTQELSEAERERRRAAKQARREAEAKAAAEKPAENGNGVTEELKEAVAEAIKDAFAVTAWQPREVVKFIVDCPSGQKVLLKHLDTKDLLRANLLEEMDRFTKELFPQALDAQGAPVVKDDNEAEDGIWSLLRDPEKRVKFMEMTNRLLVVSCVKPRLVNDGVALRENDEGEKEEVFGYEVESIDEQVKLFGKPIPPLKEGQAYVGVVEFADRMTIFQELNKPLGMIEPFRGESDAVLASLQPSQSVSDTSERPV